MVIAAYVQQVATEDVTSSVVLTLRIPVKVKTSAINTLVFYRAPVSFVIVRWKMFTG